MNIGNNIKIVRELKNLSREYVAKRLGMSSSGYTKIERDLVEHTVIRILQIAEILDVEFELLIKMDPLKVLNLLNDYPKITQTIEMDFETKECILKYIHILEEENEKLKTLIV